MRASFPPGLRCFISAYVNVSSRKQIAITSVSTFSKKSKSAFLPGTKYWIEDSECSFGLNLITSGSQAQDMQQWLLPHDRAFQFPV
jgi:hypothetical protein